MNLVASSQAYEPKVTVLEPHQHQYTTPNDVTKFGEYSRSDVKMVISEEEAVKSPPLIALHARLELTNSFPCSTLARCLTCKLPDNDVADNYGLSILGKDLLAYYATEYLIVTYPRIPTVVLNAALGAYISKGVLADIGKGWGIEKDSSSSLSRYLNDEPVAIQYGKLRYQKPLKRQEDGIIELGETGSYGKFTEAMSSAVRSIIAGVHIHLGKEAARQFIYDHVLSRKVDIGSMFQFEQATRELSRLCLREGLEAPTSRLLAETGRFSATPVFVVGVFSGSNKLGEGQGSSLIEGKIRAAVNALKSWYLYQPIDPKFPSEVNKDRKFNEQGETYIDPGTVFV